MDQPRPIADRSDQTRARILEAATAEFAANGLAGARTERIAEVAGVNKALIYYYFHGKQALYDAAIDEVASRIARISSLVLERDCTPGERLLRFALNHFDRIYSQPVFQTLMQQEMIRFRKGETSGEGPIVDKLFRPMSERMFALAEAGIRSGELIPAESSHLIYAIIGPNVFYFLSAPMFRLLANEDAFTPSALAARRKAAVEFLGLAIFNDRKEGARLAASVLADTPMPDFDARSLTDPILSMIKAGGGKAAEAPAKNIDDTRTSATEVRKL